MSKTVIAVRVRPFSEREKKIGQRCIVSMKGASTTITNPKPKGPSQPHTFTFDFSYWSFDPNDDEFASQEKVFIDLGAVIMDNAFNGYNNCLFAYGQTGSGKTYSMMGYGEDTGIIPRLCKALVDRAKKKEEESTEDEPWTYKLEVSFLEIYNEKVKCLLNPSGKELKVRDHPQKGPVAEGLACMQVETFEQMEHFMNQGNKARTVASTAMNATSSRSHSIFTISFTSIKGNKPLQFTTTSRINLVDLAGSERADKTGAAGATLVEGANINKSLSVLGKVISTLATAAEKPGTHVPYRESSLTWLLRENLGGNSKTIMIATLSPDGDNYDESLSTLRYADQAKRMKTKAVVNEDPATKKIRELQEQVQKLKQQLASGGGIVDPTAAPAEGTAGGGEKKVEELLAQVEKDEQAGRTQILLEEQNNSLVLEMQIVEENKVIHEAEEQKEKEKIAEEIKQIQVELEEKFQVALKQEAEAKTKLEEELKKKDEELLAARQQREKEQEEEERVRKEFEVEKKRFEEHRQLMQQQLEEERRLREEKEEQEKERLEEERKKLEEAKAEMQRKLEEEEKHSAAEKKRLEEEAKQQAEERQRLEEQLKQQAAEEKQKIEEKLKAEQEVARKEMEAKVAEEKRIREERIKVEQEKLEAERKQFEEQAAQLQRQQDEAAKVQKQREDEASEKMQAEMQKLAKIQQEMAEMEARQSQLQQDAEEKAQRSRASSLRRRQAEDRLKELEQHLSGSTNQVSTESPTSSRESAGGPTPPQSNGPHLPSRHRVGSVDGTQSSTRVISGRRGGEAPMSPRGGSSWSSTVQSPAATKTSAEEDTKNVHARENLWQLNVQSHQPVQSKLPTQQIFKYKVMFIGHEDVGKTSLKECLLHTGFSLFKSLPSVTQTTGIEVTNHQEKIDNGWEKVTLDLSLLDFAGQTVYHSHGLFLTDRSLYVFVWKLTNSSGGSMHEDEMNSLVHWLKLVQARAAGCQVILVGTHRDMLKNQGEEAVRALITKVKEQTEEVIASLCPSEENRITVAGIFAVSCKNRSLIGTPSLAKARNKEASIPDLLKHIRDLCMEACRSDKAFPQGAIPGRNVQLMNSVEHIKNKGNNQLVLPIKEYIHMASTFGIRNKELLQVTLLLHTWTNIYVFNKASTIEELKSNLYIFLQPQWLWHMVSAVFAYAQMAQSSASKRGKISCGSFSYADVEKADKDQLFQNSGILTTQVANVLFCKSLKKLQLPETSSNIGMCLQLLCNLDVIYTSVAADSEEATNTFPFYFIPSLFPHSLSHDSRKYLPKLLQRGYARRFKFNIFPDELFARLQCRLQAVSVKIQSAKKDPLEEGIKGCGDSVPPCFRVFGKFKDGIWIGEKDYIRGLVLLTNNEIVMHFSPKTAQDMADADAKECIQIGELPDLNEFAEFVHGNIQDLCNEYPGVTLTPEMRCCITGKDGIETVVWFNVDEVEAAQREAYNISHPEIGEVDPIPLFSQQYETTCREDQLSSVFMDILDKAVSENEKQDLLYCLELVPESAAKPNVTSFGCAIDKVFRFLLLTDPDREMQ